MNGVIKVGRFTVTRNQLIAGGVIALLILAGIGLAATDCGNGDGEAPGPVYTLAELTTYANNFEGRIASLESDVAGLGSPPDVSAINADISALQDDIDALQDALGDIESPDFSEVVESIADVVARMVVVEAVLGVEEGIGVEPLNLTFIVNEGSGVTSQTFQVDTYGQELMWVANESYTDWPPFQWLSITPSIGNTTVDVTVTINAGTEETALDPGAYHADIDVLTVADLSTVSVTLYVVAESVP